MTTALSCLALSHEGEEREQVGSKRLRLHGGTAQPDLEAETQMFSTPPTIPASGSSSTGETTDATKVGANAFDRLRAAAKSNAQGLDKHIFAGGLNIDELFAVWYRKAMTPENHGVKWDAGTRQEKGKILQILKRAKDVATGEMLLTLYAPEPAVDSTEWKVWKDKNRAASIELRDAVSKSIADGIKVQSFTVAAVAARLTKVAKEVPVFKADKETGGGY
jgi:hypothetical protein